MCSLIFLVVRKPFSIDAMKLIEYGHKRDLKISVSNLSMSHIHYLIGRFEGKKSAGMKIKEILKIVEVLSVHRSTIESAAYSDFHDFEDAIQNYIAEENSITNLITRNVKDYSSSNLSIQTPREFIRDFENRKSS